MSMVCRISATPRHLRNRQYPNGGLLRTDHERAGVCDGCEIGGDIVTATGRQVLVAGDWNGNANWGSTLVRKARTLGVSTILQLGDFGIWTRRQTNAYLDSLETVAERSTVDIYAIGGNHENYDDVEAFERHRDDGGFVPLRQHVSWVPRGHRWTWDGVRFDGPWRRPCGLARMEQRREAKLGEVAYSPDRSVAIRNLQSKAGTQ